MVRQLFVALIACCLYRPCCAQTAPNFDDIVAKATAARSRNDVSHALELYAQAVQINPKWSKGWWFLGLLNYERGSYSLARDALSKFIELAPDTATATALRGLCEYEVGDYEPALADIELGSSLAGPEQARYANLLQYRRALLLTRSRRFDDASTIFTVLARGQVVDPEMMTAIALAALHMPLLPKEAGDKVEFLTAVGTAVSQFMRGDPESGGKQFRELLRESRVVQYEHYVYGYLLFPSDPEGALLEFKAELELYPSNQDAQIMSAWVLLTQKRPSEALIYAQRAALKEPQRSSAQLVLGRSLAESGDTNQGLEHLEKALRLNSKNLEIHIALAKAYSRSGRKLDAQRERLLCLQMTQDGTYRRALP